MNSASRFVTLAGLLILVQAQTAFSREQRLTLRWQELAATLSTGQKVQVIRTDKTAISGRLTAIEPEALEISIHSKQQNIARGSISRIEFRKKSGRKSGRIRATAIGGGIGAVVAATTFGIANNEGGLNSGKIVGTGVGIAIATTAVGYFWGKESDEDLISISIVAEGPGH